MNARTAVVIGAGTIGGAIAAHLEASGWAVTTAGHRQIELTEPASIERFFSTIARVDLLVNAAGGYGAVGRIRDVRPEVWARGLELNLVGVYACCHFAIPRLAAGGHIVNLGGGGRGAHELISNYTAAKSALWRFTETLAAEEPELHVNAIAPGPMDSRMQTAVLRLPARWADQQRAMRAGRYGGVSVENTLRALDHLLATRPSGVMLFARDYELPSARRVAGL